MTYSIVARDPETGVVGGAVQTRWFAVGAGVLWVEPGVGAVADRPTFQATGDPAPGTGFRRLRRGMERRRVHAAATTRPGRPMDRS